MLSGKLSKSKSLIFILLTLLNVTKLAYAGNGVVRGGGDHLVRLQAMLPRSIHAWLNADYLGHRSYPIFTKHRCNFFLMECGDAPEQVNANITLTLQRHGDTLEYAGPIVATYRQNGQSYSIPGARIGAVNSTSGMTFAIGAVGNFMQTLMFPTLGSRVEQCPANGECETFDFLPENGQDFRMFPSTPNGHWNLEVNGRRLTGRAASELFSRINQIQETLRSQTDFASADEARGYFIAMGELTRISSFLSFVVDEYPLPSFPTYDGVSQAFLGQLNTESAGLLNAAQALISPDGSCDTEGYASFIQRLQGWQIGSPAYFYEMDEGRESPLLSDRIKLDSSGVRQRLRLSLNRQVAPYCEPSASAHRSRIDLALAD